ncbi:MAG: hypothetical protein WDN75_10865 [Bacteroidota bacterium]
MGAAEKKANERIESFFQKEDRGEFGLVKNILESLPANSHLHLANSMTVRYANHIGISSSRKDVNGVFKSRHEWHRRLLQHGRGAFPFFRPPSYFNYRRFWQFFYDRNAFWHNYPLPNLFVVVLNNHGGIIFNLIDGPAVYRKRKNTLSHSKS